MLNVEVVTPALQSKRCVGTAVRNEQSSQAGPSLVCELITLHGLTHDKLSWWDAVFAGAALFVVYARARWSELLLPWTLRRILLLSSTGRGSQSLNAIARTMLLVSITDGVCVDKWAEDWLVCRRVLGIRDRLNIR